MSQQVSVSLEKEHIRAVERYGKRQGIKAFSTALQSLIHQFEQSQKATEEPKQPADATPQAA